MDKILYRTRFLIGSISSMASVSQKLLGVGKPYEKLLLEIRKLDPEGDEPCPTDRAIIKTLGINPNIYRKWMNQIYTDLIALMKDVDNPGLVMKKLEHHIICSEQDKRLFFITTLPETPRVGSSFQLEFYRPVFGNDQFYVDNVSYRLLDDIMIVSIYLRTSFCNEYVKYKEGQEEHEAWQKGPAYWWEWIKKKKGYK